MNNYDHLVRFDEESKQLIIYRVDQKGEVVLFTKTLIPEGVGWDPNVVDFARLIGENLLMDSPVARRLLGL